MACSCSPSTLHCCFPRRSVSTYCGSYALDASVVWPTWKELVYVFASRVSRISENAVNIWVKEIKSICQVKGQPEINNLVKSQSKYLVSQTFERGWRSEYMIYRSATPLYLEKENRFLHEIGHDSIAFYTLFMHQLLNG